MLQKNVYILYPAGYGGSFINWAINASDRDLSTNTVNNPVNKIANIKFGGTGTSHNHVRIPTHQSLESHMAWVYLNRPDYKHVYIINTTTDEIDKNIVQLLQADRDGVFICIHHNNDSTQKAFGAINSVIKWPSYFETDAIITKQNPVYKGFDIFNCAQDRQFRNFVVKNFEKYFQHNAPVNYDTLDARVENRQLWYNTRHRLQPHEVNSNTYIDKLTYQGRIFEISLQDLFSSSFIDWFDDFMQASNVSTEYNTQQVRKIHLEYLEAQTTLQWFKSINDYEQLKIVDSFLHSHSIIEACFLIRLFGDENLDHIKSYDLDFWKTYYNSLRGTSWPELLYEWDYENYPDWIKEEMIALGYKPKYIFKPNSVVADNRWENLDLVDIVKVF